MSRVADKVDREVQRGATWTDDFALLDESGVAVDLSAFSAVLQVRELDSRYGVVGAPLVTLGTVAGGVTVDAAGLHVRALPAAHSALNPGNDVVAVYAYGIELSPLSDPGDVFPFVSGVLTVHGEEVR